MDQLRADALVNGVLHGIGGELPTEQGRSRASTSPSAWTRWSVPPSSRGWLDGYGPISAGYARQLGARPDRYLAAADHRPGPPASCWTTAPPGTGHPASWPIHVIERDGECTFPYCSHSARRCRPGPHRPVLRKAKPRRATCSRCTAGTTTPRPKPAGQRQRDPVTGVTRMDQPARRRSATDPRWPQPPTLVERSASHALGRTRPVASHAGCRMFLTPWNGAALP